ncbi:MAG TPA: hypothetical protein VIK81_02470 [Patescibacteria group bacterium]
MDINQFLLILVIVVLTVFLVVIGIQVFFVLQDLRKTLDKLSKVLTDAGSITEKIKEPVNSLSSFSSGFKAIVGVVDSLKSRNEKGEKKDNGK